MLIPISSKKRDALLALIFFILNAVLILTPTGFEAHQDERAEQVEGRIASVDDSGIRQFGIVKTGAQTLEIELLGGKDKGKTVQAINTLLGKLEMDKMFVPGDRAFVVVSRDDEGRIAFVNPIDHYRLDLEFLLFGLFAAMLLVYGGLTGVKALLSFGFSALVIWKVLIPSFLKGYDPILVSLGCVTVMTGCIIFLIGGLTRKGATSFIGSMLGVVTAAALAEVFTGAFHIHGAIKPFAESLLYTGYAGLNLREIFVSAVFIGCCGAMMDLSMDVAASIEEVANCNPDLTRRELFGAGIRVGRAVVGTMTTTLLFAYSGGYITLLMMFMAQGVPISNLLNLIYVAAEVLNTLVGSFGLVMVAPFTALIGAALFGGAGAHGKAACGRSRSRSFEVEASVFGFQAGDKVAAGMVLGADAATGEKVVASAAGRIRSVAFDPSNKSLMVTVEEGA